MPIIKREDLPGGGWRETYDNGRQIEKDRDGRFVKTILPPDVAKEMGAKSQNPRRAASNDVNGLLFEAGFETVEDAPLTLVKLAEVICDNRSNTGKVSAVREFVHQTRGRDTFESVHMRPGDVCPTCKQYYKAELSGEAASQIVELFAKFAKEEDQEVGRYRRLSSGKMYDQLTKKEVKEHGKVDTFVEGGTK